MESKMKHKLVHLFNGGKKKPGPILHITIARNKGGSIPLVEYQYYGNGDISMQEVDKLKRHLRKNGMNEFADFLMCLM